MIAAGYMYKMVARQPDWLKAPDVDDIYSVSGCVSPPFTDYVSLWRHNGYWLFDRPAIMRDIAEEQGIDLSAATLFYFEVFEEEFDEESGLWSPFAPDPSFTTAVAPPAASRLEGYDAVTFTVRTSPECSPLSCNNVAGSVGVNRHCLFRSLDQAKSAVQDETFKDCEPGPFRIFAVHTVAEVG
jgi:hypothetical protein